MLFGQDVGDPLTLCGLGNGLGNLAFGMDDRGEGANQSASSLGNVL